MKRMKQIFTSALSLMLVAVILLLAGCGKERAAETAYSLPARKELNIFSTTCVAENERYSLIWNAEKQGVILYDKIEDCEWSYIPEESLNTEYDYTDDGEAAIDDVHPKVKSPILVHYFATSNYLTADTNAYAMSINYDSGKQHNYSLTLIDNGIEMMCYFEHYQLAVPVAFTLTEDGIDVSVDPTKIQEGDMYNVYGVTIAPFFCSVSNKNADKDGYYMFIPSGSGAIITPTVDSTRDSAVKVSETVYGEDANVTAFEYATNKETARVPVYGAVNGDKGVCAIIKDGAETARINTVIGEKLTGYSYINTEFHIRGYQEVVQNLFTSTVVKTRIYSDAFTTDKIVVSFNPLYGDDASYVGMAQVYREYLAEQGKLSTEKSNDSLLNLKFFGGIETKEFHFGIPSDAMLVATTVNQASNIIKDVKDKTGLSNINANLIGFGESGNDIGVVAGNYEIGSDFGDDDDLKKLIKYTKENGVNLFMNFDMLRFRSSGGGVSTSFGKADAASGSFTELKYYTYNMRNYNSTQDPYYLVTRRKFSEVAANIEDAAKDWGLPGISLDTLTSLSYSDYSDRKYYSRADFDEQSSTIINKYTADGYLVAGSDANAYAAACCSHVYDVPTQSSKYRAYAADVPFYQLVFKGSVSLSGYSMNLATDADENFLKAVETGIGLTYTLIGEYDTNLITSAQNVFYGSVYWDKTIERGVRDQLVAKVAEYKDYFDSVNGQKIENHVLITEDVRMTVFENGITVYVNYGDTDYTDGELTVEAGGYKVKGA